ncbi:UDP-N-acetylmuramoyl-tripeptide--D-alanyl-D-alanine ligase [Parvularcula sp. ZS-1/3]|uniref:UDP-N-acetylmuramoyl-tripeptide--D-alanyl-D-alanine ligase n=1 Tax=Parvularcula mediterranea TaxID=2732508 RepID=A0A7Y3W428_9PROT|nr:UDP-N-acetylmuramoyl-tripeptide--D-alanyl-D-alanine ligase [Parvularcula mediterranea]NNU15053.1 UDP-N-acetylmuramoyl-tripeptide--D-alanyl-D-alanine ligase [Parvularcula mediterranea]
MSDALWQAYQVQGATGGKLTGGDWSGNGLSIDTRTLQPGDIFVALEAERDGHNFVPQAFEKGAAAAIVTREIAGGPCLIVNDTLRAVEAMARTARDRSFAPLIGVTGSAGKTTTKEMLRACLEPMGEVHAAEKSFNNHIGVPLTLAELPPSADVGVFEMGMNHAGEIRALTSLVQPHIALITTIAAAHLEFLGSMEAIADAKAEIAEGLRRGGAMIIPGESRYAERLEQRCREAGVTEILRFGEGAFESRLNKIDLQNAYSDVDADILGEAVSFRLHVAGPHHVRNAAAALTAAKLAGLSAKDAAAALEQFRPGAGRGEDRKLTIDGKTVLVLDESYNANPASMEAALSVLSEKKGGRRIAILGEMKELGPTSPDLHAGLAPKAAVSADIVHTAGADMAHLRDALPAAKRGSHAETAQGLLQPLLDDLHEGDTVLFKGSNASRVGALVEAFLKVGTTV